MAEVETRVHRRQHWMALEGGNQFEHRVDHEQEPEQLKRPAF